MGSVTKEEYESLLARKSRARQQPERQAGELLAIFVPGRLVNPLNAHAWGWRKRSRTAKAWKERVAVALLEDDWGRVALRFGPAPAPTCSTASTATDSRRRASRSATPSSSAASSQATLTGTVTASRTASRSTGRTAA
jgi:hypothetical protein